MDRRDVLRMAGGGTLAALGAVPAVWRARNVVARQTPVPVFEGTVIDLGDHLFDLALFGVPVAGNIYGTESLAPVFALLDSVDDAVREATVASPIVTGDAFAPDLELIASLEADLILSTPNFARLMGDQFALVESLAPVTLIDDNASWQERTRAIGAAVGLETIAAGYVGSVESRLAALRDTVAAAGGEALVVGNVRPYEDQLLTFVQPSLATSLIGDAGFRQPVLVDAGQPGDSPFPGYAAQIFLSLERIGELDGDVLVVFSYAMDGAPLASIPDGTPVDALRSVQAGQVFEVPYFLWALNSAVGAMQVVLDLETIVTTVTSD